MTFQISRLLGLTALCLLFALSTLEADEKKADGNSRNKPTKPKKLEECELGSTYNVHRLGDIYLAGQPSQNDFAVAKREGIKTVINLRQPSELPFDQKETLKNLGLEYHHIPFALPQTLTDKVFEKCLKVLSDRKKQPVLLHCKSANRVGAIWLVHRVLNDKVQYDKALKEAKEVGLRYPPYEAKARLYIAQKTKAKNGVSAK